MNKRILILLVFCMMTSMMYSQIEISPRISTGIINHNGRSGVNLEVGMSAEIIGKIDLSIAYRAARLNKNKLNLIQMSGISSFLSFVLVNNDKNRFLLGPGYSYGLYSRNSESFGFEKEYHSFSFNPIKISYERILQNVKMGPELIVYGDDGDGAVYLGFQLGYKF